MNRPAAVQNRPRLDLLDPFEVSKLGGLEVITEGVVEGFLRGLHRSPRRGFSVEFAEHRMYQPGDELRYVDWKILGRNDRLYVKQFEEETNLRAMVVCDASRSMAWTGRPGDRAAQARLRPAADRRAVPDPAAPAGRDRPHHVRRRRPDACCRPRARLSHWRQLLATLGALEAGQGTAAEPALRRVVHQLRRRGLVVFVSDLLLDRELALKALRFLRHRGHQVLVLHVMDPGEVALGRAGRGAVRGSGDRGPRSCFVRGTGPGPIGRRCAPSSRTGGSRAAVTGSPTIGSRPTRRTASVLREALAPSLQDGMIGFLHPWALAGLVAAAIPLLLHLLARREPPTVVFPAVRYLITTTQEHQRRLKLQHLLLLLLPHAAHRRAGAGGGRARRCRARALPEPRAQRAGARGGQLAQQRCGRRGVPADWPSCKAAARRVLERATPDDALWLLAADGVPRRGDRAALLDGVAALPVSSRRARPRVGARARR